MEKTKRTYLWITAICLTFSTNLLPAGNIRVAVASNFSDTIKEISKRFETDTNHKVTLVFGSTGKHYAQIKNGAPFEVFFAADKKRAQRLEKEGVSLPGSRFTYAIGKLALWSPKTEFVNEGGKVLDGNSFRYLALANPKLAPYGKAAEQVLQRRGLWNSLHERTVRGENIGQAFQFIKSGNAELGFVAYSQIKKPDKPIEGSYWLIPPSLYDPIEQQAVLLKDNSIARSFLDFVKSNEARAIIKQFGYGVTQSAE